MVGVGKLLKQAQKMQQKMEEAQASLSDEILEVSGGGGAVSIKISGMGEFKDLKLDPEFLKEDPEFVSEAILQAIVDASEQAKKKNDEAMSGLDRWDANAWFILKLTLIENSSLNEPYERLVQSLKSLPGLGLSVGRKNCIIFTG